MGLDSVELIFEIEKHFEIQIPDIEAEKISTVGDIFEHIIRKTKSNKEQEELFNELKILISKKLGVRIERIKYESTIVQDLGID